MTTISSAASVAASYVQMRGARGGGHGKPPDFAKIDSDGSGGLDKTELKAMMDQRAAQRSGSSSGTTSTDSTTATSATSDTQVDDLFSKLDTDGDGSITEAELKAGAPKKNGSSDGQGSLASMGMSTAGFAGMMGPPPGPPPSSDEDSDDSVNGTSSTSANDKLKQLLKALDTDEDGTISDSEVTAFSDQLKSMLTQVQQRANAQYQSVASSCGSDSSSTTSSSLSVLA